jgi:hypothetical protein
MHHSGLVPSSAIRQELDRLFPDVQPCHQGLAYLLWQFPEIGIVSSLGSTELLVEAMGDAEV